MLDIHHIAEVLWRPIPRPRRAKAKAQQSWHQLKPGQRLISLLPMVVGGQRAPADALWEVVEVDSKGAWIYLAELGAGQGAGVVDATHLHPGAGHATPSGPVRVRWTDPDWKRVWKRAGGRGRTKKEKPI